MSGRTTTRATMLGPRSTSTSSENSSPSRAGSPRAATATVPNSTTTKPSLNPTIRRPNARPPTRRGPLDATILLPENLARRGRTSPDLPLPKHGGGKGTRIVEEDESDGNKENIAPFRLASINTNSRTMTTTTPPTAPTKTTTTTPERNFATGVRFYSESYTRATLPSAKLRFARMHVIEFKATVEGSKDEHDGESGGTVSLDSSPRLRRSVTSLERDGRAVFRFGKVMQSPSSSCGSDEDSGEDSDSTGKSHCGSSLSFSGDGLEEAESSAEEVEDSDLSESDDDSDVDSAEFDGGRQSD